jgi:RecG-like helicase
MSLRHRLTASTHRLDAAELESEVERLPCAKLKDVERGETTVVGGRVRSVKFNPTANVPVLEAELFDGSCQIQLVWLGRRRIAGIEPGRKLLARGRVGVHNGALAIYNPWYELQ